LSEKKATKDELLRYAIKALDQGDTDLAKKFMDEAEAVPQTINEIHEPPSKQYRSCQYCGVSMPANVPFCKKCGKRQVYT